MLISLFALSFCSVQAHPVIRTNQNFSSQEIHASTMRKDVNSILLCCFNYTLIESIP